MAGGPGSLLRRIGRRGGPAPRASVVMCVWRDFRFFDAAVASVLAQDMPDLELVVVDDGNGPAEAARFAALAALDSRIRVIRSAANIGTAAAANLGIAAARSPVIVRLDADDLCEPERVGRLVAALDGDPGLGLVGSAVRLIRADGGDGGVVAMPQTDLEIRWTILFHNPFYHSAAAYRRALFDRAGGYRPDELVSQDHYLWFDLLPLTRARNLAEPLTRYRLNPEGLTVANNRNPRARTHAIRERLWSDLGLVYDLYDDSPAQAVTAFLRGANPPQDRAAPAFAVIERVLAAFLAGPAATRDAATRAEAAALAEGLRARMAAVSGAAGAG